MATLDKGEQIFDSLLLDQYSDSPNLKEFAMCFIAELDFLFQTVEECYVGRMLENATGEAQDIIGIILNEGRGVVIPNEYFGFVGAAGATKMADAATPSDGGVFKSAEETGFTVTPLSDELFKRLLKTKASILNNDTINVEDLYNCVSILLDRAPSDISVTFPTSTSIQLELATSEVTAAEESLILYAAKWFVPTGKIFTINRT